DATTGDAAGLHAALAEQHLPALLRGSSIEIGSSWTPSAGENDEKDVPMDLGSRAGGPERLCQLFFVRGDVRDTMDRFRTYTTAVAAEGLATPHLVAPFFRTIVGTDTYTDQLW